MMARTAAIALGAGILLVAGSAAAGEDEAKAVDEGEVRVFVSDDKREFLDGAAASVTVQFDFAGLKSSLHGEAVAPVRKADGTLIASTKAGDSRTGLGIHGGQVVSIDGYAVELVVRAPGGAEGTAERAPGEPYFGMKVQVVAYQDSMKCVPPVAKAGKCSKCGMEMAAQAVPFTADVAVTIGERTVNARGFRYPVQSPATLEEALGSIELRLTEIEGAALAKKQADLRVAATEISRIAGILESLAPAADREAVGRIGSEIVELFAAINGSEEATADDETKRVVLACRNRLALLKKFS